MLPPLSLKISKYTVDVEVRDVRGEERQVQLYLSENLGTDGRPERFQDVLLERRFIPVQHGGKVEMVSVHHALWFRVDLFRGFDDLDPQAETAGCEADVRLDLDDGSSIEGVLRWYMPQGSRRLVDYLATLPEWVPMRTPEWLYLVNRDCILRVVPIEES